MPQVANKLSRQEQRSSKTREQLLETAVKCICELGYNGATISLIADRANVTRGALHHHFHSRADFMEAVVAQVVNEIEFGEIDTDYQNRTLEESVGILVDHYWDVFSSQTFLAVLHVWLGAMDEPKLSDKLFKGMAAIQSRRLNIWQELFESYDVPVEAVELGRTMVLATLRGLAIQNLFQRKKDRFPKQIEELKVVLLNILRQA